MDNKIEKKTVLVPNNVIDYAEGGIVSKEFIHSNAGSVTLFAFDKGQRLSEHTAPYDAVLNIIDGVAEIMIEDELYHPKAGEMIIIPTGARHAVNANDRFKMTITMIRG
ncbi:cupin domain-containing protein [Hoylesella pleuritidis]|uniref:cupin domain-containing protein n=1 Tax=Hoylesella pleuritidis TaxID=407975 RepID=UPI0028ECB6E7|nr:cupin domain-containing protein [Hoylesella pleuritidis]